MAVKQLEKATMCMTGSWHKARWSRCRYSSARLFNSMPRVFSEVLSLMSLGYMGRPVRNRFGQATLASVGISVLHICGGRPVVLVTCDGYGSCSVLRPVT